MHFALVFVFSLGGVSQVAAIPIEWTFHKAIFDSIGGEIIGSFVYDADLPPGGRSRILKWDFKTTESSIDHLDYWGTHYTDKAPGGFAESNGTGDRIKFISGERYYGYPHVYLEMNRPLSNAGGEIAINSEEWRWYKYLFRFTGDTPQPTIHGELFTGSIPEPGIMILLATGIFCLAGLRLKIRNTTC